MKMIYDIHLDIASVFFTVIVLIYHVREFKETNEANRQYRLNAVSIIIAIFFDILASLMISNPDIFSPRMCEISNTLYYAMACWLAFGFSKYAFIYIIRGKRGFIEKWLNPALLIVYMVSLFFNIFFSYYFYVNTQKAACTVREDFLQYQIFFRFIMLLMVHFVFSETEVC